MLLSSDNEFSIDMDAQFNKMYVRKFIINFLNYRIIDLLLLFNIFVARFDCLTSLFRGYWLPTHVINRYFMVAVSYIIDRYFDRKKYRMDHILQTHHLPTKRNHLSHNVSPQSNRANCSTATKTG